MRSQFFVCFSTHFNFQQFRWHFDWNAVYTRTQEIVWVPSHTLSHRTHTKPINRSIRFVIEVRQIIRLHAFKIIWFVNSKIKWIFHFVRSLSSKFSLHNYHFSFLFLVTFETAIKLLNYLIVTCEIVRKKKNKQISFFESI